MEMTATLTEVREYEMRRGGTRYVARDDADREYTTFRDQIGKRAKELQGTRVTITFHEEERGQYKNVYLDGIEPAPEPAAPAAADGGPDTDPQEAAWRTAVEAAPWLVGEPGHTVEPDELYDKLKPFEERVAQDIRETRAAEDDEDNASE